ncbi:hypothetical protein BB561_003299 [Smittium simulii]|uniref:CCHC-type domain-containing protein n=1 Tax=Smittium simulii TaxID=133385 RepID=A0A2T9YM06_9FUNG|nr:hypothetical protein BB561_003299 [Smittium simulii]
MFLIIIAVARTRAFGKWASLRTWISDLIKCPYKHRCDTWVSGCARWTKKYNGNISKIKNTIETLNNRQKKNDKSQISKWIADTEAGTSCNWMGLELVYPELKTHINYVFKIRNGTYWTARRYANAAAEVPLTPAKRTRLEYSTVAKTGLIGPASKNDYNFNFPTQNNQKNQKTTKKFEKNNKKNNMNTTPKLNPINFTEVSIKHLLDGSEPQSLKKICFGGSDKKIGCGWSQFSGDIDADIEYVSSFIVEQAIQFMKTPIFVNENRVELYQTIKLEEGAQIISISSAKNLSTPVVVDEINKIFSIYGTIIDFSAFKNKKTSLFHTYGIKFLFKKNTEEFKIPEFIDIEDEKIALTYRECVATCSYCKKVGHWRTECPDVKKHKDSRSKYLSNKSQNTTYGVNNTKNNNQNIVGLVPSSILDTKIINLFLDVRNTIDKKNGKKKLAQKSLNEFQNFQNFIESLTNDRTQDGTNSLGKNTIGTEVQTVVQRYDTPSEPNRAKVQATKAMIINSNCDQPKIIPKGLYLAGNKLTKEINRVLYNEITLEASEIDFGTDYSCTSSPPVVEMMDSNDGIVDDSKV